MIGKKTKYFPNGGAKCWFTMAKSFKKNTLNKHKSSIQPNLFFRNSSCDAATQSSAVQTNQSVRYTNPTNRFLEDHPTTCRWLITIVNKSPGRGTPSKWPWTSCGDPITFELAQRITLKKMSCLHIPWVPPDQSFQDCCGSAWDQASACDKNWKKSLDTFGIPKP